MTTKLQKREKEYQLKKMNEMKSHQKWDKKSIIISIIISSFLVSVLVISSIDIKGIFIRNNHNWNTINGTILSYEKATTIDQTLAGNIPRTTHYKIQCLYIVDKIEYKQDIMLKPNIANRFFAQIEYPINKEIEIFYKKDNPTYSYINTNINSDFYKDKRK
jgi:hypothetical protein